MCCGICNWGNPRHILIRMGIFDLVLSASVLASSSEEDSTTESEGGSVSCCSHVTPVTTNTTTKRKLEEMEEFYSAEGITTEEWFSLNIDIPASDSGGGTPGENPKESECGVEGNTEAEGTGVIGNDSKDSSENVDLGSFSSSGSRGESWELSPEELARICVKGETGADLTDEQQKKFRESLENSKKYEEAKERLFEAFLGIIAEKGGKLSRLGSEVVEHEYRKVPALVKALNCAKNRSTRVVILDECLKLFAEFYRQSDGSMYSPGSLKTYYKRLFSVLRLDYNVDISVTHFSKKGSFRSVTTVNMQEARKGDKKYGITKGMSRICIDDLEIVYSGLKDGALQPKENPFHLKLLVSFILLRLYGLRAQEAAILEVEEVSFCAYDRGPDKGKMYCQLKMDFDKTHKLKFDSGGIPENYGKLKIRDNPEDDVFNAYYFMKLYYGKLKIGSRTRRFLRRPIGRATFNPSEESTWYNNLVVSQQAVSDTYKNMAPIIGKGCSEFALVTGHGGRACLVTYSLGNGVTSRAVMQQTRHMNESGLQPYKRVDPYTDAVFQDVLDGVFLKDGDAKKKLNSKLMVMKDCERKESESTYSDRKPAAVEEVKGEGGDVTAKGGGGSKEDAGHVCNVNSTSEYGDVVKQLQHELADLKKKMEAREAVVEASSPAKKAKREQEGEGVGSDCDGSNAGGNGVARVAGNPDATLVERIARENEEMRRMIHTMRYGNGNVFHGGNGGIAPMMPYPSGYSPFPSSNSYEMQQYASGMSPYGDGQQQHRDLPNDSRHPSSEQQRTENPERPDLPNTTESRSDGNGGTDARVSVPTLNIPCVVM